MVKVPAKKYVDNLSRFRNDVMEFSGIKARKKGFSAPVTRKEKRKMTRKLKSAKKMAFTKKELVCIFLLTPKSKKQLLLS